MSGRSRSISWRNTMPHSQMASARAPTAYRFCILVSRSKTTRNMLGHYIICAYASHYHGGRVRYTPAPAHPQYPQTDGSDGQPADDGTDHQSAQGKRL